MTNKYLVHLCGDDSINQECADVEIYATNEEEAIQLAFKQYPEYHKVRIIEE